MSEWLNGWIHGTNKWMDGEKLNGRYYICVSTCLRACVRECVSACVSFRVHIKRQQAPSINISKHPLCVMKIHNIDNRSGIGRILLHFSHP